MAPPGDAGATGATLRHWGGGGGGGGGGSEENADVRKLYDLSEF